MNSVIDSDGHVFEIDDLWENYADPAYRDRWPRLITDSKGRQIYLFEGRYSHTGREVGPPEGSSAGRQREGASNPRSRLADMDIQGIDIAALFPAEPKSRRTGALAAGSKTPTWPARLRGRTTIGCTPTAKARRNGSKDWRFCLFKTCRSRCANCGARSTSLASSAWRSRRER